MPDRNTGNALRVPQTKHGCIQVEGVERKRSMLGITFFKTLMLLFFDLVLIWVMGSILMLGILRFTYLIQILLKYFFVNWCMTNILISILRFKSAVLMGVTISFYSRQNTRFAINPDETINKFSKSKINIFDMTT